MIRRSMTFACLAALAATTPSRAEPAAQWPTRFAPADLQQDGRITLTPAFTPDGRTIYFAQSERSPIWECPQRLKRSVRSGAGWSTPEPVALPAAGRVDWPSVSPDGRTLWFSWATQRDRHVGRDVFEDFDLYTLDLMDPDAVPQPVDAPDINRIRGGSVRKLRFVHNETAPSLTRDGDLYFWTERLDGLGERDVYIARGDGQGRFEVATPLPPPVNSPGRDNGAWVDPDGDLMLLTYNERGGSGGDDLFVSRRGAAGWSTPVNLGPRVNSPQADFGPRLTPDRAHLVFSSTRAVGDNPPGLIQTWTIPVSEVPALGAPASGGPRPPDAVGDPAGQRDLARTRRGQGQRTRDVVRRR